MYCQVCGAQNTEDARFCNMCGGSLAQPGETGGLIADAGSEPLAAPTHPTASARPNAYAAGGDDGYGGESMLSVSLAGIGVRSNKKTWTVIALLAITLVALGATVSWLATRGEEVAVDEGHAEPDDPFVIGAPLPTGVDVPDVDYVAGAAGGTTTMRTGSTEGSSPMTSAASDMSGSGTSNAGSMTTGSTNTAPNTGSTTGSTTTGSTTGSTNTGSTTEMSTPSETSATEMTASTMTGTSTPGTSTPGPTDIPEERDFQMDLYSSQVRFVIQRYYAARAQTCFEHATRNNPTVSGVVVVSMTIGADGGVSGTRPIRNTTGNAELGTCLATQVSSWRLPAPPGGELEMQMPFSR